MVGGTAYAAGKAGQRAAQSEAEQAATAAPPAAVPTGGPTDLAAQLSQLKGLMDEGALSPAEFEAAKQKLLAG